MERLEVLKRKEARRLLENIRHQWDAVIDLDSVFLTGTNRRIYMAGKDSFSIDFSKMNIDSIGLYFGTMEAEGLRLSIEGSQIVGPHAKKNIIDLDDAGARLWMSGSDVEVSSGGGGFLLVRHGGDFLGCGKVKDSVLRNFYPKSRRISPA